VDGDDDLSLDNVTLFKAHHLFADFSFEILTYGGESTHSGHFNFYVRWSDNYPTFSIQTSSFGLYSIHWIKKEISISIASSNCFGCNLFDGSIGDIGWLGIKKNPETVSRIFTSYYWID
jgi:hypothetical protein